MSIRFAAARSRPVSDVVFAPPAGSLPLPANDHDPLPQRRWSTPHERVLREALRHFAEHGIAAAARARDNARAAHRRGETGACARWLEICRTLDRRMAEAANREISGRA